MIGYERVRKAAAVNARSAERALASGAINPDRATRRAEEE
jgi:hypothetical protein